MVHYVDLVKRWISVIMIVTTEFIIINIVIIL